MGCHRGDGDTVIALGIPHEPVLIAVERAVGEFVPAVRASRISLHVADQAVDPFCVGYVGERACKTVQDASLYTSGPALVRENKIIVERYRRF
jgi:hypothetical protein